jgi:hypothetical protein
MYVPQRTLQVYPTQQQFAIQTAHETYVALHDFPQTILIIYA